MEEITPEQFLANTLGWNPTADLTTRVAKKLGAARVSDELAQKIGEAFHRCSRCTYDYIQYINGLAASEVLDQNRFLPLVAQLGRLVQGLRESGERYEGLFKQYDETTRSSLQKDHFDTVYYDVIQGVDIRELLKPVLDEVEIVLQSFSLVSAELSDIRCVDLYEGSIRFQLFLQYFLLKESFSDEELWSVLFDVYNQVMEIRESFVEYSPEELAELQEKIKYLRNN